ncbi:MAG: rhodanese family protein [Methylobacillus sp.]|jgi:rhodanese-related sulfurtransferase|nr:rhodanese family protein [Methylobacillus sp.]
MKTITANQAKDLLDQGALLIDIRESAEHAQQNIAGAINLPLAQLPGLLPQVSGKIVIFHCLGGKRTAMNVEKLAASTSCEAYLLEGGLQGWLAAGLSAQGQRKQSIDIMRQVQIGAGALVLLGAILGYAVSPWFYLLSAFVGAGLMMAGLTGFCGMAILLKKMPWNRA